MANTFPTPPPDTANQITDVPPSTRERIMGGLGGALAGGAGMDFGSTPLAQALHQEHAQRIHQAQGYQENMATSRAALEMARHGINPATHTRYEDETDPTTGQKYTPEAARAAQQQDFDRHQAQYQNYLALLTKSLGNSKAAKNILAQGQQILNFHLGPAEAPLGGGQPPGQAGAGALAQSTSPSTAVGAAPDGGGPSKSPFDSGAARLPNQPPPGPAPFNELEARTELGETRRSMEEERQFQIAARAETLKAHLETLKAETIEQMRENKPPTTLDGMWMRRFHDENGRWPDPDELTAHYVAEREKPIDALLGEAIAADKAGDPQKAQQLRDMAQKSATAKKGGVTTGSSLMAMIVKSQTGTPEERAAATQAIQAWRKIQNEQIMQRGIGFGLGRAMYTVGTYLDTDSGEQVNLTQYDAIQQMKAGKNLLHVGALPVDVVTNAQRFVQESGPAIKQVRNHVSAYDDPEDRAIFARVLSRSGPPATGEYASPWLHNYLDQVAKEHLSKNGQELVVRLARLNDTVGLLRKTLGAPATDTSMGIMMMLIPGPNTPNSEMANDMLDQLEQNVNNAVQIPAMRGVVPTSMGGPARSKGGQTAPPASQAPQGRGIDIYIPDK